MAQQFPPRGFGPDAGETAPDRRWGNASKLSARWDYSGRKILLGSHEGREIGDPDAEGFPAGSGDDRHIVTIAGTRAGKSSTVLVPNLRRYPGSVVVIDPKGELAETTAHARRRFGDVHILDPFRITSEKCREFCSSYNPFSELTEAPDHLKPANAALIADALIVHVGNSETHWTDAARNFIRGLVLHLLEDPLEARLGKLREYLSSDTEELIGLIEDMAGNDVFDGIVANTGRAFRAKLENGQPSRELQSIMSTANEQTWPLDDVTHVSDGHDFYLSSLSEKPMTVYLVLPASRLATHAKWLRLMINLTITAIEQKPVRGLRAGALPIWLVLEEFAALGNLRSIETAAGFMAGMGCKLWVVLQDLTQLKTHYPNSWETFLGNAGILQAWSNVDATTTEYLSKLIGQTTILETRFDTVGESGQQRGDTGERTQFRTVPLLDAAEVGYFLARETGRQLILSPGRPPLFLERLKPDTEGA
ncbi:type IV secretory system conjugative DNA transfer family protein [uncultured Devosia sp.]|uniref:type IV secretory system conjugative DNA transfer family protein n=1 Tax=uncultured Devosia sp. TaxID=211434 RepID=UPI00260DE70B|nr:type IV secretory system conjugative DNA transfer family protein [uncultured Devosia sp.]